MNRAAAALRTTLHAAVVDVVVHLDRRSRRSGHRDRGDVPGWVLITVMTAGLVSAIWLLAGPILTTMFQDSLSKVTGK
ncbi:MAG: hypothetical protein ABJA89_04210 [Lapillicoccus sp.]